MGPNNSDPARSHVDPGTQKAWSRARQRLVFPGRGEYLITIRFEDNGEPYVIQFPVHIGEAAPVSVVTMAIIALAIALVLISLTQRRRLMSGKVRQSKPNQA